MYMDPKYGIIHASEGNEDDLVSIETCSQAVNFEKTKLSEATVDAVTNIGRQLICGIASEDFKVILHPMARECINVYVLVPSY
ncbi:hypothetical protein FQA39_LY05792 [Lamprigera yunnana]|nr:hypothetical protein FQA39_LY05792 [Lamprigera yunnana]